MLGGAGNDAVIVDGVAVGGTEVAIDLKGVTTGELGGLVPTGIPLYTAPAGAV